ncbi:MAG TPA: NAD(P)-dependent oxidoreductase [Bauldia sp.]|nr:NAD(P)-dependent oxidoreductase [Bauldia sp.]
MTVLVTGGTGTIGSNVARQLIDQGRKVVVYDRVPPHPSNQVLAPVADKMTVEIGNITDLANVFDIIKRNKVESIIHLATMLPAHANNTHPIEALQVSIIGSANMLEAGRLLGIGPIVITSAAGVMGRPEDITKPQKEEDVKLPIVGVYPLAKLACEQLVATYRTLHKVNATAVRPRNVYGPGAPARAEQPLFEMVYDILAGKDFVRDSGADSTFDYTYVKDLAKGILQVHDMKETPNYVYNLSFGKMVRMAEAAEALSRIFPKRKIKLGPGNWEGIVEGGKTIGLTIRPAVMPPQDITRARKEIGFNPEYDLSRGLADWFRFFETGTYQA